MKEAEAKVVTEAEAKVVTEARTRDKIRLTLETIQIIGHISGTIFRDFRTSFRDNRDKFSGQLGQANSPYKMTGLTK